MTWTYSGDPSSTSRDKVRFLVGDTQSTDPLVTDEEIAWLLTETGSAYPAAIMACETIAARFARLADSQVDDVRVSLSQRSKGYYELAVTLRRRASLGGAVPYVGGTSISGKENVESDTDRVRPIFTRDLNVVVPGNPITSVEEDAW